MGRIKTLLIKRIAHRLIKVHGKEFTSDFDKNKEFVERYTNVSSTKIRNSIAGYTARLIKQQIAMEKEPRKKFHEEDLSKFYQ